MASDPMVRESEEQGSAPSEDEIQPTQSDKIKIEPITETEGEAEVSHASENGEMKVSSKSSKVKITEGTDSAPSMQADEVVEVPEADVKAESEPESDPDPEPEPEPEPGPEKPVEKPTEEAEKVADKTSEQAPKPDKKEDEKKEVALDPAAVELERAENLKNLIASKKYRLNIKETKDRSSKNALPIALLILLAMLSGFYAAVDSGALDVGVKMPFHIFNNEAAEVNPDPAPVATTPEKSTTASAEQTQLENNAANTIPKGYIEYKNTTLAYSIWYPETMEPSDDFEQEGLVSEALSTRLSPKDKETPCCSLFIESVVDTQGETKIQLAELAKSGGAKAVADESQRINKEDKNPNITNKTVSEVKKSKRGSIDTYEFIISGSYSTGFFSDTQSGMTLDKPALIIFFETPKGVIRIQTEANNSEVDIILQTLAS